MRLNNKGFGLSTLVIVLVIFIVAIIFVSILSYNVGVEKGSPNLDNYEWQSADNKD